jgi:hypothetical protein
VISGNNRVKGWGPIAALIASQAVDLFTAFEKSGEPSKGRRPEGRRLKVRASGNDAPMLAGELRVGHDRSRRRKVEIALEG